MTELPFTTVAGMEESVLVKELQDLAERLIRIREKPNGDRIIQQAVNKNMLATQQIVSAVTGAQETTESTA